MKSKVVLLLASLSLLLTSCVKDPEPDPIKHFSVLGDKCIDLYDIAKDWAHPNADGQDAIARQVIAAMRNGFNV